MVLKLDCRGGFCLIKLVLHSECVGVGEVGCVSRYLCVNEYVQVCMLGEARARTMEHHLRRHSLSGADPALARPQKWVPP